MRITTPKDITTIELLESFWTIHWDSYTPTTRTTRRGRLVVMAASLLDDRVSAKAIVAELKRQNVKYGTERPAAKSHEAWVARYLLDYFLPAPEHASFSWPTSHSPEVVAAGRWIREHSKPARQITGEDLVRFRAQMGGRTYQTLRTYWAFIEKVIHWAVVTGHLQSDPLVGLPAITRQLDAERIDPDLVPEEAEVWAMANAGGELEGEWFKVAVLLGTFGAMRIGEIVALRRRHIQCVPAGGSVAHHRYSTPAVSASVFGRRQDGDGFGTSEGKTHGVRGATPVLRSCPCGPGDPGVRRQPDAGGSPLPERLWPPNGYRHLPGRMAQGDGDRACRPTPCRHHTARHATRRNVHVVTSGAGPKADSELGWVALAHRDA